MLKQMMQFVEDQVLIYGNTSLQCSFHSKQKVYYSVGVGGGGRGGEVYAYVSGVCVYVGVGGTTFCDAFCKLLFSLFSACC